MDGVAPRVIGSLLRKPLDGLQYESWNASEGRFTARRCLLFPTKPENLGRNGKEFAIVTNVDFC